MKKELENSFFEGYMQTSCVDYHGKSKLDVFSQDNVLVIASRLSPTILFYLYIGM